MAYVSLDSEQIKKANKKHKYTKDQVLELEKCMDKKSGPLYFMKKFMKIQHPTKHYPNHDLKMVCRTSSAQQVADQAMGVLDRGGDSSTVLHLCYWPYGRCRRPG